MFILIAFWFGGTALVTWLHWPIPGSVVGLLGLWVFLIINRGVPTCLKQPSNLLLRYLTLLFVPAGVGLIQHWTLMRHYGLHIILIISISSLLAALAMVAVFKLREMRHE